MKPILKSLIAFLRGAGSEIFTPLASTSSGPAITLSAGSRSTALRASGPITLMSTG